MKKLLLSLGTLAAVAAPVAAVVACGENTENENHEPADSSSPMKDDQAKEFGAALGSGVEVSNAKKDVTEKDGTFKFTPSVDTKISGVTLEAGAEASLKFTYTSDESGNPVFGDLQVNGQILSDGITDEMNSFLTNMLDWDGHVNQLQQEKTELDGQKDADAEKLKVEQDKVNQEEKTVYENLEKDNFLEYMDDKGKEALKKELSGHVVTDPEKSYEQIGAINDIRDRVQKEHDAKAKEITDAAEAKSNFENWKKEAEGSLNPKKMLQVNIDKIKLKLDSIKQGDDRKVIDEEIKADTVNPMVFSPTSKDQLDGGWVITTDSGVKLYLENGHKDTSVSFTDMSSSKQVTTEYKVTKAAVLGSNSEAPEISVFIDGVKQSKLLESAKYNQKINIDDSDSKPTDLVLRDVSGTYFAAGQGIAGTSLEKGVVSWGKVGSYVLNFLKFNLENSIDKDTKLQDLENMIRGMMLPGINNPADTIGSHDSASVAHCGFIDVKVNQKTGKLESFEISTDELKWGKKAN